MAMHHGKTASCWYQVVVSSLSTIGGQRCCHWAASLREAAQWQHSFYIRISVTSGAEAMRSGNVVVAEQADNVFD